MKRKKHDYADEIKLFCKLYDLPMPVLEFKFMPDRKFRVDMAYPTRGLMIEIEGGIWVKGRHNHPASMIKEMEKYNLMAHNRYWLLRYTPQQIKNGSAFADIKKWFDGTREV